MSSNTRSTAEFLVLPLREADIKRTHDLYYEILEELHSDDAWALQSYKNAYNRLRMQEVTSDPNGSYWTAKANDDVVGFGFGRTGGGVGFINWIGIRRDYRKRGIGSAILKSMEDDFAIRGCHKLELYTYQHDLKLFDFYKKRGYDKVAQLNNHYYNLNVIYMTKALRKEHETSGI